MLARLSYRRAVLELQQGNVEAAEEHLRQALKFDPRYPDAYFTLARIKARQFDVEAPVYLALAINAVILIAGCLAPSRIRSAPV